MLLQVGRKKKKNLSDHTHKQILDAVFKIVKEWFKTQVVISWGIHQAICLQNLPKTRIIMTMIVAQTSVRDLRKHLKTDMGD